jgi:hypothetical protein
MTISLQDDDLIAPYWKDFMIVNEYEWDRKYGTGGANSGLRSGVGWYGSLDSINVSVVSLPSGHGLSEGRVLIALRGGSDATIKSRIGTLSGNTISVDPTWTSDSETLPGGTITAYVTPMPKSPTASVPQVNTTRVGGTAQTPGDVYNLLSRVSAVADTIDTNVVSTLTDTATLKTNVVSVLTDTASIEAKVDTVDANVDAVLVDTGTTLENRQSTMSTNLGLVLADTGTDGVKLASGTYSAVTIGGVTRVNSNVTIANADYSAVTVRPKPLDYSGLTVGVGRMGSNVTLQDSGAAVVVSLLSYNLGDDRYVQEALFALRNRVQLGESKATVYKTDDTTSAFVVDVTRSNLSNIGDFDPA